MRKPSNAKTMPPTPIKAELTAIIIVSNLRNAEVASDIGVTLSDTPWVKFSPAAAPAWSADFAISSRFLCASLIF